eukprot:13023955-Ditylum_brightwellii.AAC.1
MEGDSGHQDNEDNILIVGTGGGRNSTITKRAWHIFKRTNRKHIIKGYGDNEGKLCSIVNAAKKAWINERDEPVILILNHATLIEDPNEKESLMVPFELMRHGVKMDLTPRNLGGEGAMFVDEEYMPFNWDEEKLYLKICKPND